MGTTQDSADIEIQRDHLLTTLHRVPTATAPVVFIEGESGAGSTTLLDQFARKFSADVYTLFVRPASRLSYSPEYLRQVLGEQFADTLGIKDVSVVDESQYRALLLALRKRRGKHTTYFVIDGLHQIPASDSAHLQDLMADVLPIGVDTFRFLITGEQSRLGSYTKGINAKSYQIADFSLVETQNLFSELGLGEDEILSIHQLCGGLPGRLAIVRRLLKGGSRLDDILQAGPKEYLSFIDLELGAVDTLRREHQAAVATVAFAKHPVSCNTILSLTGLTPDDLAEVERKCSFIRFGTGDEACRLKSETHRRWAEKKLADFRNEVHDGYINHFSVNSKTADAIEFLPSYMLAQNRQQALMEFLSPDHYEGLLKTTKSMSALRARAGMGAKAALELKQARELFQFSLQKSIFVELESSDEYEDQVGALVALGQTERALDIASQAVTNDARLRMLSAYARGIQSKNGSVDSQLKSYIRELVDSIQVFDSQEYAERLAENIAFFDPDLAIEVLDKPRAETDDHDRDLAFAKLGINSTIAGSKNTTAILEKASSRISDEKIKSLIGFVASIAEGVNSTSIIEAAEDMDPPRRIQFLRSYLSQSFDAAGTIEVVEYALDQLVDSASYVPKLKDFADFCGSFERCFDKPDRLRAVVKRVDAQLGLTSTLGSTADHVRVQMRLAQAETVYDRAAAVARTIEAYYVMSEVSLPETKVECAAVMLSYVQQVDVDGELDRTHGLMEILGSDLRENLAVLLESTANHYETVKGTLGPIVGFDPTMACDIAERLNTRSSRNAAYELVVTTLLTREATDCACAAFARAIAQMSSAAARSDAALSLSRLGKRVVTQPRWADLVVSMVTSLPASQSTGRAGLALVELDIPAARDQLVKYVTQCADTALDPIVRIELRFGLARVLSTVNHEEAADLFQQAMNEKAELSISSTNSSKTVRMCLSLLLRVFKALIKFDELNEDLIRRFALACDALRNPIVKVCFLNDLACKAWCENKLEMCRGLIEDYVQPVLDLDWQDEFQEIELRCLAFPAVFLSRGAVAFDSIANADKEQRDDVLEDTANIILRRVSEGDHWSGDIDALTVSPSDAEDCCELLSRIRSDDVFYRVISALTSAISNKNSRKITRQKKADLRQRLMSLIEETLPDQENIRHVGYKIVSQARCGKLIDTNITFWRELLEAADSVPNFSDAVLVKLEIAECMPVKFSTERRAILAQVKPEIASIPSAYDRFWRMESLVDVAKDVSPPIARDAIKDAYSVTFELADKKSAVKCRRQILNVAEIVDPNLADSLVESLDDDPARSSARLEVERQKKVARAGKRLTSQKDSGDDEEFSIDVLPTAAWKRVGSLVAGKMAPVAPQNLERSLMAAGSWDLHEAYPVLSLYIENLGKRLMRPVDVASKLAPLAEAVLLTTELAIRIIGNASLRSELKVFQDAPVVASSLMIATGQRDEALQFLRSWFRDVCQKGAEIVLCDPYFTLDDLPILQLIAVESDPSEIVVLSSKKALGSVGQSDIELAWRKMSEDDPPLSRIILVTDENTANSPVHDRWVLDGRSGLKVGTSFNGLGSKLSEICNLNPDQSVEIWNQLRPYVMQERFVNGAQMRYGLLSL